MGAQAWERGRPRRRTTKKRRATKERFNLAVREPPLHLERAPSAIFLLIVRRRGRPRSQARAPRAPMSG